MSNCRYNLGTLDSRAKRAAEANPFFASENIKALSRPLETHHWLLDAIGILLFFASLYVIGWHTGVL